MKPAGRPANLPLPGPPLSLLHFAFIRWSQQIPSDHCRWNGGIIRNSVQNSALEMIFILFRFCF